MVRCLEMKITDKILFLKSKGKKESSSLIKMNRTTCWLKKNEVKQTIKES